VFSAFHNGFFIITKSALEEFDVWLNKKTSRCARGQVGDVRAFRTTSPNIQKYSFIVSFEASSSSLLVDTTRIYVGGPI
jgi:hypothetical protein